MLIENEYGNPAGRNKTKELIAILLESRFYLEIPLKERLSLIKMIIKEYQFLS
jgi:hypothetical protein